MRGDLYQYSLIFLGIVTSIFLGSFFYNELYPEYRIYQKDYVKLEEFRSTYTNEPPPEFKGGVKQIVLERADKGNPVIDRCISCHVALQIEDFSATTIAKDVNGKPILDENGFPVKIRNKNYIWAKLDEKIADLEDEKTNKALLAEGKNSEVRKRLQEASDLKALKVAHVDDKVFDVTKVLSMHPLIGKESRPFEFHPVDDYGCTSCHNGNGRGLTTEKSHGPVLDGHYHTEYRGFVPQFHELDGDNDPQFAKIFNSKPGHELLFQTTPIFIGALIESRCVQCHQPTKDAIDSAVSTTKEVSRKQEEKYKTIQKSLENDEKALVALLKIRNELEANGYSAIISELRQKQDDYTLPANEILEADAQYKFLASSGASEDAQATRNAISKIDTTFERIFDSKELVQVFLQKTKSSQDLSKDVKDFIQEQQKNKNLDSPLFKKAQLLSKPPLQEQLEIHNKLSFDHGFKPNIDLLINTYQEGKNLYISQACYACHRISGFARGGVGPELTKIGLYYPWYIKESIVWPQADLPTSTMPNFRLDHQELEALVTFLLGQTGESRVVSESKRKEFIQEWEAGKKLYWEEPVPPQKIHDLRYGMTVFATEGCAACHRLKGFESDVGYSIEKEGKVDFDKKYNESVWFTGLFPETILGSDIVRILEDQTKEIDTHIVNDVRQNSILEEIELHSPETIESFYTPFRYASRAKNDAYAKRIDAEPDPDKKMVLERELQLWKDRVHRVLMIYIQEYGLGRLICPRPNWAGVYRTDEWLFEHFRNPSAEVPKSLMPIFPFDDTKFLTLTYMLDVLGKRNAGELRSIWNHRGFNPEMAFEMLCAQCHGDYREGNGPVSEWIYPIPKNLRNADFLRSLTKERVIESITHGVKGTPMPPWGEVGQDKWVENKDPVLATQEISQLVEWLFTSLPGGSVFRQGSDVPKWNYTPEDVLKELEREKSKLQSSNFTVSPERYYVALNPDPSQSAGIGEIFDVRSYPVPEEPDLKGYYIKHKYYTPENIEKGKFFFEMNCAACHGKEADGSGLRAFAMQDAKPRMLTNLNWLNTRDDLRLLRSIKYGVPGTAMTPWGDQTSVLQRLQLVIFIRSLSEEKERREKLGNAIYESFDRAQWQVENARVGEFDVFVQTEDAYRALKEKERALLAKVKEGQPVDKDEAVKNYEEQLVVLKKLNESENLDQQYKNLKSSLKSEGELYHSLGNMTITSTKDHDEALDKLIALINLNKDVFVWDKTTLQFHPVNEEQAKKLKDELISLVEQQPENAKLKRKLLADLEEAVRMRKKQQEIYQGILKQRP